MPLDNSGTNAAFKRNVSTLMDEVGESPHVQSRAQALAIAYSKKRGRAIGGSVVDAPDSSVTGMVPPMSLGSPSPLPPMGVAGGVQQMAGGGGLMGVAPGPKIRAPNMTKGPILSTVPGRTDAHQTHVPSGSYVIPADIVSGRGQGNTLAGADTLQKLFKMGPYGSSLSGPYGSKAPAIKMGKKLADGGVAPEEEEAPQEEQEEIPVRVNLAGGEIVVPPENLMEIVHGDLKRAHEIMDAWVIAERKALRKTLAKLPGPVKE